MERAPTRALSSNEIRYATQKPPWHLLLQQFPLPLQAVLFNRAHVPALLEPAGQQPLGLVQHAAPQMMPPETGVPAQTPLVQTSPVVHGLPSLQTEPLVFIGLEQTPVAGAQVPAL